MLDSVHVCFLFCMMRTFSRTVNLITVTVIKFHEWDVGIGG